MPIQCEDPIQICVRCSMVHNLYANSATTTTEASRRTNACASARLSSSFIHLNECVRLPVCQQAKASICILSPDLLVCAKKYCCSSHRLYIYNPVCLWLNRNTHTKTHFWPKETYDRLMQTLTLKLAATVAVLIRKICNANVCNTGSSFLVR